MIEKIRSWPRWVWWGLLSMLGEVLIFWLAGRTKTLIEFGPMHSVLDFIGFAHGGYFIVFMYFLALPESVAFYLSTLVGAGIWFFLGALLSRYITNCYLGISIWVLLSIVNMIIGNALWDMVYF